VAKLILRPDMFFKFVDARRIKSAIISPSWVGTSYWLVRKSNLKNPGMFESASTMLDRFFSAMDDWDYAHIEEMSDDKVETAIGFDDKKLKLWTRTSILEEGLVEGYPIRIFKSGRYPFLISGIAEELMDGVGQGNKKWHALDHESPMKLIRKKQTVMVIMPSRLYAEERYIIDELFKKRREGSSVGSK